MRRMIMSNIGVALLVVAAAMATDTAMADETWFCVVKGSIVKYQVVGKELTNLSAKEYMKGWPGEWKGGYQVLEDTPQGIVAATHRATKSHDGSASVWVSIILINKETKMMRELFFSTEERDRDSSVRGQCEPG